MSKRFKIIRKYSTLNFFIRFGGGGGEKKEQFGGRQEWMVFVFTQVKPTMCCKSPCDMKFKQWPARQSFVHLTAQSCVCVNCYVILHDIA